MAKKLILTTDQAETAKLRAANFFRNVQHDEDRAEEIEAQTVEQWAEETGRTLKQNPRRRIITMPSANSTTKRELEDTLDDVNGLLEDALDPALTREEVIQKLQAMDDLINGDDDDEDDDEDEDEDGDSDSDEDDDQD